MGKVIKRANQNKSQNIGIIKVSMIKRVLLILFIKNVNNSYHREQNQKP